MSNERNRILTLVENGTISAQEAITLLEKLEATDSNASVKPQAFADNTSANSVDEEQVLEQETKDQAEEVNQDEKKKTTGFEDLFGKAFQNKDSKVEDVFNEFKKDLSDFGTKLTGILNTTFSKVKGFDQDMPFGEKVELQNSYAYNIDEVNGIEIDVPNSKVEVTKTEEPFVSITAIVKTGVKETEDETKEAFFESFAKVSDGKLTLKSHSKFSQVQLKIEVPEKQLDVFFIRALNGDVKVNDVNAKIVKISLMNGPIQMKNSKFHHADIESKNGSIETRFVEGDDLEVETVNGRIYIDGKLKEVEAQSVNGHVVVTTESADAHKVKAVTVAGAVEIYVPKTVSLDGKLATNFGKFDLGLTDVAQQASEDSFLQKTVHFDKMVADQPILKIVGESKTGTVLVRYTN